MKTKMMLIAFVCTMMHAQGDLKINSDSYFDYFYSSNNSANLSDVDGFAVRRVYLTFNKKLNDVFSARVRFEAAGTYFKNPGDKHYPFIKDMYVKYKINNEMSSTAGLQGNILLKNYEKFYGLRYIEKSPNDLYRFHSSRDIGVRLSYKMTDDITYSILLGNGEGDKSEFNKGDMIASTLAFKSGGLLVEASGMYNSLVSGNNSVNVLQAIAGYEMDNIKFMVSGHLHETMNKTTENVDQMKTISFFSSIKLGENMLFGRLDMVSTGIAKSPSYYKIVANEEFNYFIAGMEFRPEKFLYVTPNISFITYDNSKIDSDFIGRLTLRIKW